MWWCLPRRSETLGCLSSLSYGSPVKPQTLDLLNMLFLTSLKTNRQGSVYERRLKSSETEHALSGSSQIQHSSLTKNTKYIQSLMHSGPGAREMLSVLYNYSVPIPFDSGFLNDPGGRVVASTITIPQFWVYRHT